MGQYESMSFGAEVELTDGDMGLTDHEVMMRCKTKEGRRTLLSEIDEECIAAVHGFLQVDIDESKELTLEEKSFLVRAAARRMARLDEDDDAEDREDRPRS